MIWVDFKFFFTDQMDCVLEIGIVNHSTQLFRGSICIKYIPEVLLQSNPND